MAKIVVQEQQIVGLHSNMVVAAYGSTRTQLLKQSGANFCNYIAKHMVRTSQHWLTSTKMENLQTKKPHCTGV